VGVHSRKNLGRQNKINGKTIFNDKPIILRPACQSGRPDWANFRPLGDCLLWDFFKITKVGHIFMIMHY
jgi:hypothetical protein